MLDTEVLPDISTSPTSTLSSTLDIEDFEPLSPAEYTIVRQEFTPADHSSHAANMMPEPAGAMDDIDTDFGTDSHAQEAAAAVEQAAQNSQAAVSDAAPAAGAEDDRERRKTGAAAGPSRDGSPTLVSDSDDDHVPLSTLVSGSPLEGSLNPEERDVVQRPNGLAQIRVNGGNRPEPGAAAAEKLQPVDAEAPTTPTPVASRDAVADRPAGWTGDAAAERPAKTAAARKPLSLASSAADGSSSSEEEDESESARPKSAGRKKRRNLLPAIRKADRCGKCQTCLNPKMKKACLTRRAQQMAELDEKGELPVVLLPQVHDSGLPSNTKSRAALQDFSALDEEDETKKADPFEATLQQIIGRNGGVVQAKHLEKLLRLLDEASTTSKRLVLLTVVESSSADVKSAFVHSRGFMRLHAWLEAADDGVPASLKLARKVLVSLGKLPIDVGALQDTGAGKLMRRMSKSGPESLRGAAKQVLETWKKRIDALQAAATKRPAPADGAATASPKKARTEAAAASYQAANGKPGPPKAPTKPGAGSGALQKPAEAGRAPADAKAAPAKTGASGSWKQQEQKPLAVLAAADLDEPVKAELKPKPSVRDALYNPKKVHQVKVLDDEAAQKLAAERAEAAAAQKVAAADNASASSHAAGAANGHEASSSNAMAIGMRGGILSSVALPAPAKFGSTTRISTPIFGSLGMPTTGLGGPRPPPPLTSAATRAAQAAARVPSPERGPPRPTRKKVSWVPQQRLVSVRWFLKAEPVAAVYSEGELADESAQPPSDAAQAAAAHPPGFESAARAEHRSEAAAIRGLLSHSAMPEDDEADVPEMEERVAWGQGPPQWKYIENSVACGEGSEEKKSQRVYWAMLPPVHYGPGGLMPPDSPEEPPNEPVASVLEKRMPLNPAKNVAEIPASVTSLPPVQHQQPQYQQPPPQQMHPQSMPQQVPQPHQMGSQQGVYVTPPFQQLLPASVQLPPPPQQPQQHYMQQPPLLQQHQPVQAQPDYVEQQLQQLQPPPQQRGILGRPPVTTAAPVVGVPPIQLPVPAPLYAVNVNENVVDEARLGGPAGRGCGGRRVRGGGRGARSGRHGGPAEARSRGARGRGPAEADEWRQEKPRQGLPCAFYNLHLGCRLGDRCRFAHEASDETPLEIERRAQAVSTQPLQLLRNMAPGEKLHVRGPSIYNPDAPVESGSGPGRGAGGAVEESRKRGRERSAAWERNSQPRRERDREFDG